MLEEFDLQAYHFVPGAFYRVPHRLSEVLFACAYAKPDRRQVPRRQQES